jgi:two-component system, OmpR family, response regulator VicR
MARKIMIVEDEPDIAELVRLVLETRDYEVRPVLDSTKAYDEAKAWKPDAMLVDLRMPKMDGWSVFRAIRNDPQFAQMPVAILTAKAEEFDAMVGLHVMKADAYITKPFGKQELIDRVNELFQKRT